MSRPHFVLAALTSQFLAPVLAQQKGELVYELPSPHLDDRFSHSLAGIGDLNGDRVPDIVVGGPDGPAGGMVRIYSGADGGLVRELRGPGRDRFGARVRRAGDIDRDGWPDFLVAAPGIGRVFLYSGATRTVLRTFVGAAPGFGEQIDGVGDVDLDGVPDVAVADSSFPGTGNNAGRVTVYSGATGSVLWEFTGNPGDELGFQLSTAGDWNGDGHGDIAMLAAQSGSTQRTKGYAVVHSGKDGSLLWKEVPRRPITEIGLSMRAGVDVTGDGVPDLLLAVVVDSQNQYIQLYSGGALTSSHWATCQPSCGPSVHRFGFVGDIDGDGTEDYAIAWSDSSAWVRIYSGTKRRMITTLQSELRNNSFWSIFAWEIDRVGDLNGDGRADILVGGRRYPPNGRVGALRAFSPVPLSLRGSVPEIASMFGGTLDLELSAGAVHAGQPYWLVGTASGIAPGTSTGSVTVPLNADDYTGFTITSPFHAAFSGFRGTLDPAGNARASLRIPGFAGGLLPFTLHHAFLVLDGTGTIVNSSNASPLRVR